MGNCGSGEVQRTQADLEISKQIRTDMKNVRNEIKLLLLGAGDGGKSTIAKQIKIIFMRGFSDTERRSYRVLIHRNIIGSVHLLVTSAQRLGYTVDSKYATKYSFSEYCNSIEEITPELCGQVKEIWEDPGIQEAFKRGNEYSLSDNTKTFMENIDQICQPDYLPPDDHLLLARFMTIGVQESVFKAGQSLFRMVDVGGQRGERRKWVHCFQDVNCVLYCMSLSEYDQSLMEDENVNRMGESLTLFEEVINCNWFQKCSIILFMNKCDLLKAKLPISPLSKYFPDFQGGSDYEKAVVFIRKMFLDSNRGKRTIHTHVTCALKTDSIRNVFGMVQEIIVKASFEMSYS